MNSALVELLNCCRCCLNQFPEGDKKETIDDSFRSNFFDITGIQLVDDNDYSNTVCGRCFSRFNEFVEFRNELIVSQRNLYECREEYIEEQAEERIVIADEDSTDSYEIIIKDLSDNEAGESSTLNSATNKDSSQNESDTEPEDIQIPSLQCDYCGKRVDSTDELALHLKNDHLITEGNTVYPCMFCKTILANKSRLNNHLKNYHSEIIKMYSCDHPKCEKSYPTKAKLTQHKKNSHDGHGFFHCAICDKYFSTKLYLQKHFKQCHTTKILVACDICSKTFPEGSQFRQHMLTHSGRSYECPYEECDKKFQFKASLGKHIETCHEATSSVSCEHCSFTCPTVRHLARHVHRQHNDVKVECEVQGCTQLFSRKDYLAAHYKSHKNIDEPTKQMLLSRIRAIKAISW